MSQTVDRALSILPLLAEGPADLGQVADRLGVHKSTALRLLRTLHEHGLVYRQSDQRYRLGARLFALAQEAMENLDIREIAHPHLVRLNEQCGHTVHLAVYEENEVLYIDKVESRYPVRMYSRIGKPVAITVAAVAKLLLADLPEPERRALAQQLDYPLYTARSTPHAEAFLKELATVREQGWATDLGGHEESINCMFHDVGLPVIVLSYLISVVLRVAQGSATVAIVTTAGIVAPLLSEGHHSQAFVALVIMAISAGSIFASHVNDGGFWMVAKYFGISERDTLRTWTVLESVLSLAGFVVAAVVSVFVS
ncbi:GntT/GntP/DsdX family permease [Streptomyces canarius]